MITHLYIPFIIIILLSPNVQAYAPILGKYSPNYVGYYVTANNVSSESNFTGIYGSWRVEPALTGADGSAAQWIGISNYNAVSGNGAPIILQIGTVSCYKYNWQFFPALSQCYNYLVGSHYWAWIELLSDQNPPRAIMPVNINDRIIANIKFIGILNGTQSWSYSIKDLDNGQNVANTVDFNVPREAAEWIDERPLGSFGYYPLSNFVNASFGPNYVPGGVPNYALLQSSSSELNGTISSFNGIALLMNPNQTTQSAIIANISSTGLSQDGTGSFMVQNFRAGPLFGTNIMANSVIQGKYVTMNLMTVGNIPGAAGGTGSYDYTWLKSTPGNDTLYVNATECGSRMRLGPIQIGSISYNPSCKFQTNSLTTLGDYSFKLQVHARGGPANEILNTTPINFTVIDPPRILQYVPITLMNNQSASNPIQFQQLVIVDSVEYRAINSQWSNVEFTAGANATGTILPAWVESGATNTSSHTLVWVRLSNSIPAYGTNTIYMDIMPWNVMSANGPTGEAPLLSLARGDGYGQYDNGNSVFTSYSDFVGNYSGASDKTIESNLRFSLE